MLPAPRRRSPVAGMQQKGGPQGLGLIDGDEERHADGTCRCDGGEDFGGETTLRRGLDGIQRRSSGRARPNPEQTSCNGLAEPLGRAAPPASHVPKRSQSRVGNERCRPLGSLLDYDLVIAMK